MGFTCSITFITIPIRKVEFGLLGRRKLFFGFSGLLLSFSDGGKLAGYGLWGVAVIGVKKLVKASFLAA